MTNKLKTINDPVYGFVNITFDIVFDVMEHPYFQRLRRITQMGLSHLVYPGALHTRFHHAIGCMNLMVKTVASLRSKNIEISRKEEEALCLAILLHDIGHGPYSHALEYSILVDISHEYMSVRFMEELNIVFDNKLDLAIKIFKNQYDRPFFNQLISGQLDLDRLDYLKRDSFYTGVTEGNINTERIISILNVKDEMLVIEEKGVYSVEKFLLARRMMYWLVYLHKAGLAAENTLVKVLKRAKYLISIGRDLPATSSFKYFLKRDIKKDDLTKKIIGVFAQIDDFDIMTSIKQWVFDKDIVLSSLSKMIVNRDLPYLHLRNKEYSEDELKKHKKELKSRCKMTDEELDYFVYKGVVSNTLYDTGTKTQQINIVKKSGELVNIVDSSDSLVLEWTDNKVEKYFIIYPKSESMIF